MTRFLTLVGVGAVLIAHSASAAPAQGGGGGSVTNASRSGGVANPDVGQNAGFSTVTLIGAIPSGFSTIAALAVGPTKAAETHPWWGIIGAASGVLTLGSGIAYAASNTNKSYVATPYLITGLAAGLPAIGLAVFGWANKAPLPNTAVEVLSKADVTLAPPSPTVVTTPSGAVGIGVSVLNGRF